jgi:hypothetical protein
MVTAAHIQNKLAQIQLPTQIASLFGGEGLSLCGPATLDQINTLLELGEFDTLNARTAWLEVVFEIFQNAKAENFSRVDELLVAASHNPDFYFGKWVLCVVSDLFTLRMGQAVVALRALSGVRSVVFQNIRYVSHDLLAALLQTDLLYYLEAGEVFLSSIRYAYYVAEPEYDGGEWGRQFVPFLKKNQEMLGTQIKVLDKMVSATVEHWLAEYDAVSTNDAISRGALDRIKFVNDSENARKLSKEDQAVLLALCELYDWLSDPYVTEVELEEFVDVTPTTSRAGLVVQDQSAEPAELIAGEQGEATMTGTPNVQGVLVQVPLGASDKTGLEVGGAESQKQEEVPTPPVPVVTQPVNLPTPPKQSEPVQKVATPDAALAEKIAHKLEDLKQKL